MVFPGKRITVNLAPADIRKAGPSYDLPIAVGVLIASEQAWPQAVEDALFVGELSLDGSVRHVNGILPIAVLARQQSIRRLFVSVADAPEAALIRGLEVISVEHLSQLAAHLQGLRTIPPYDPDLDPASLPAPQYAADFAEIKGQEHVKRALEVAAAGGHNVLMTGPPGAGKMLLARSMPSILPILPDALCEHRFRANESHNELLGVRYPFPTTLPLSEMPYPAITVKSLCEANCLVELLLRSNICHRSS